MASEDIEGGRCPPSKNFAASGKAVTAERVDFGRLLAALDDPDARVCGGDHRVRLRAGLGEASVVEAGGRRLIVRGDQCLGVVRPYGSVVLGLPAASPPLRYRLLELDREGHVSMAIGRGPAGEFREAWVRALDGTGLGFLPGGAEHPLWGPSDRIVRLPPDPSEAGQLLTVCAAVDWDAVTAIPALADPTRLPAGAGSSLLNLLASLAADQDRGPLRYRGPYPTEQLFWALLESFRLAPAKGDPVTTFLGEAEAVFQAGESREAPLDWTPAPHERLFLEGGGAVQLRDGVEKVWWEGRLYYRREWQGLQRREHRVLHEGPPAGGRATVIASLEALGEPVEDHLVFDVRGHLVARPAPAELPAGSHADVALAEPWRAALAVLLPLQATPLLAPALDAVWPEVTLVWGPVFRDLVETRGARIRLSHALVRAYRARGAIATGDARRALARRLVRDILGLVGPPVRATAAAWLESQPTSRQDALLAGAAERDRQRLAVEAALRLARLVDLLAAGAALPD